MKFHARFTVIFLGALLLLLSLTAWFHPPQDMSDTERRKLKTFPELSIDSVIDGTFMSDFEAYTLDQFPFRDQFRQLKAVNQFYVFHQSDNNQIYIADGYASALVYPLNTASVQNALEHFQTIYDTYLKDTDVSVYSCIVPDKNYYLASQNGYPVLDYTELFHQIQSGMDYASFIDITDCLKVTSYYKTDTHWKQETLQPAAQKLLSIMQPEAAMNTDYILRTACTDFYGVYYGQSALPMSGETISYFTNDTLDMAWVFHPDSEKKTSVYDFDKLSSKDPYAFFLSGAAPLLVVQNPAADTDRELILFRDSFGSSLAPLLLDHYQTITLIDTRYISTSMIQDYVAFDDQDVLFLYSSLILNSSSTLK